MNEKEQLINVQLSMVDIEKKIEELKQKLIDVYGKYSYEIYVILKQILHYRKMQIANYRLPNLANEKGIPYNEQQLYYFFNFDYMTEETKNHIEKDEINHSTYLWLSKRTKTFREPEIQNKLVEKVIEKEITLEELSHMKTYHILKYLNSDKKMEAEAKFVLQNIYHLRVIAREIRENPESFRIKKFKDKFLIEFDKLAEIVNKVIRSNGVK